MSKIFTVMAAAAKPALVCLWILYSTLCTAETTIVPVVKRDLERKEEKEFRITKNGSKAEALPYVLYCMGLANI